MISALRQFSKAERDLRAGLWKSQLNSGNAHDATGRTLAILGLEGALNTLPVLECGGGPSVSQTPSSAGQLRKAFSVPGFIEQ